MQVYFDLFRVYFQNVISIFHDGKAEARSTWQITLNEFWFRVYNVCNTICVMHTFKHIIHGNLQTILIKKRSVECVCARANRRTLQHK